MTTTTSAVCRQGNNTLNAFTIPVVFVPGIMGSRLNFPDSGKEWDPDAGWKGLGLVWEWMFNGADRRRELMQVGARAEVMGDDQRGWDGVSKDFYHDFLKWLQNNLPLSLARGMFPVYAVGYDWRQTNVRSAKQLIRRIEDHILPTEDADHVILITHSMGGLVARAACKLQPAFAEKVRGVIHVTQPVLGAPVLYRRFFTGVQARYAGEGVSDFLAGLGLGQVLGNTGRAFRTIISGMVGAFELLPNNHYQDPDGQPWLRYKDNHDTEQPWTGDIFNLYARADSPPGLLEHAQYTDPDKSIIKQGILDGIEDARQFHNWLADYQHPNTRTYYGTGKLTDVAFLHDPNNVRLMPTGRGRTARVSDPYIPIRTRKGDSTVPDPSGAALGNPNGPPEKQAHEIDFDNSGKDHGKAFDDPNIRDEILARIHELATQSTSNHN